jgi:phage shock protein C
MVCNDCSGTMNSEARFCSVCGRPAQVTGTQATFAEPLMRVRQGRILTGVCGGIAKRYGVDPVLVRLITVLLVIVGFGTTLLAYITLAIVMPKEPMWAAYTTPTAPPPVVGVAA